MAKKKKKKKGQVAILPVFPTEYRGSVPPNTAKGEMLAAELTRDGALKDPAAAAELAQKIAAERQKRIETQGHA